MSKTIDDFYQSIEEPIKSCLLLLIKTILDQDTCIAEKGKYGMLYFCYKRKMYCYLWKDKKSKEPYILFVDGRHFIYPELKMGNRSKMKIFKVNHTKNLPIETILNILKNV